MIRSDGSTASEDANKRRPNRGLLRGGGAGGGSEMEGEHDAGYGGVRSRSFRLGGGLVGCRAEEGGVGADRGRGSEVRADPLQSLERVLPAGAGPDNETQPVDQEVQAFGRKHCLQRRRLINQLQPLSEFSERQFDGERFVQCRAFDNTLTGSRGT